MALSQTGVGALEHSVWKLCAASTVEQDAAMLAKQTPLDRIFPLNNVHAKGDGKKTEEMEQDGNAKGKKEDTKNSKEGGRKCKVSIPAMQCAVLIQDRMLRGIRK